MSEAARITRAWELPAAMRQEHGYLLDLRRMGRHWVLLFRDDALEASILRLDEDFSRPRVLARRRSIYKLDADPVSGRILVVENDFPKVFARDWAGAQAAPRNGLALLDLEGRETAWLPLDRAVPMEAAFGRGGAVVHDVAGGICLELDLSGGGPRPIFALPGIFSNCLRCSAGEVFLSGLAARPWVPVDSPLLYDALFAVGPGEDRPRLVWQSHLSGRDINVLSSFEVAGGTIFASTLRELHVLERDGRARQAMPFASFLETPEEYLPVLARDGERLLAVSSIRGERFGAYVLEGLAAAGGSEIAWI